MVIYAGHGSMWRGKGFTSPGPDAAWSIWRPPYASPTDLKFRVDGYPNSAPGALGGGKSYMRGRYGGRPPLRGEAEDRRSRAAAWGEASPLMTVKLRELFYISPISSISSTLQSDRPGHGIAGGGFIINRTVLILVRRGRARGQGEQWNTGRSARPG